MSNATRNFVVLIHRATGNAEVGESWIETHVLPGTTTLQEVGEITASSLSHHVNLSELSTLRCTVSLQIAQGPDQPKPEPEVMF